MKKANTKKETWPVGDVYAYKLDGDLAKEKGLNGRYFLIQKVDEVQLSPRVVAPIVYTKITKDGKLPQNIAEYNQLEYVQTYSTNYEERFWPYDFTRLEEDIAEKSQLTYEVDEYGYLPQFRALLIPAAGKHVPPGLIYVGNFSSAISPPIEFVPHIYLNIRMIYWKKNAELFERIMTNAYCGHNLRNLKRYQTKSKTGDGSLSYMD